MWIHVPSIPFPSVPGTEELSLDSEQLSQLESSAMWKSKFQQQKSWQNVWKKRLSMRRLSGLLLKPSTLNRGVEKWICSLEGSLASPSASPGRSLEKMIQETSGPTQPDLLGGLGFQSSFLKMCPESSDTTTTPYDPNYERWVTRLRKDSSQRPRLGPLTRGNDSLSWPTRAASDPEGGIEDWSTQRFQNINTPQIKLRDQAANWPTMTAGNPSNANSKRGSESIYGAVENWPTPNTMDELPPRSEAANKERFTTGQRAGRKHPDNLREFVHSEMHPENWLTPNVSDNEEPNLKDNHDLEKGYLRGVSATWQTPQSRVYKGPNTGFQEMLPNQVQQWPTPTVAEADKIGNRPNYGQVALSNHPALVGYPEREKMGKSRKSDGNSTNPDIPSIHQGQETGKDGHSCSPSCRRLNPLFAEHLMGLPPGWTSVSEPLEMGLYRQWQHSLFELLREN